MTIRDFIVDVYPENLQYKPFQYLVELQLKQINVHNNPVGSFMTDITFQIWDEQMIVQRMLGIRLDYRQFGRVMISLFENGTCIGQPFQYNLGNPEMEEQIAIRLYQCYLGYSEV